MVRTLTLGMRNSGFWPILDTTDWFGWRRVEGAGGTLLIPESMCEMALGLEDAKKQDCAFALSDYSL